MSEQDQASMTAFMDDVAWVNAATDLNFREESSDGLSDAGYDRCCGLSAQLHDRQLLPRRFIAVLSDRLILTKVSNERLSFELSMTASMSASIQIPRLEHS